MPDACGRANACIPAPDRCHRCARVPTALRPSPGEAKPCIIVRVLPKRLFVLSSRRAFAQPPVVLIPSHIFEPAFRLNVSPWGWKYARFLIPLSFVSSAKWLPAWSQNKMLRGYRWIRISTSCAKWRHSLLHVCTPPVFCLFPLRDPPQQQVGGPKLGAHGTGSRNQSDCARHWPLGESAKATLRYWNRRHGDNPYD